MQLPAVALSISHELTDWHNLFQGAIGSVIGSAIGVFGAYLAARHTIKKQFEGDRALAQEQTRIATAREVVSVLGKTEKALLAIATADHVGAGMDEAWARLSEANSQLLDARDVTQADLPPRLVAVVDELDRRTFVFFEHFVLRESIPEDWAVDTGRQQLGLMGRAAMYAHDQVQLARQEFAPVST